MITEIVFLNEQLKMNSVSSIINNFKCFNKDEKTTFDICRCQRLVAITGNGSGLQPVRDLYIG